MGAGWKVQVTRLGWGRWEWEVYHSGYGWAGGVRSSERQARLSAELAISDLVNCESTEVLSHRERRTT